MVVSKYGTVKMISWFTKASLDNLTELIRDKLDKSLTVHKLFDLFDVDIGYLTRLIIEITELDKEFGSTDSQKMRLNKSLFDTTKEFFANDFYICIHELVHFLARVSNYIPEIEGHDYLDDKEEHVGMIASCAYLMETGGNLEDLYTKAIKWHFHDENDAKDFMQSCMQQAQKLLKM